MASASLDPLEPLAGRRILVAGSGSIAAVKLPQLVSALVKRGAEVRCLLSPSAAELVSPVALASLSRQRCYLDADQWSHHEPRPLHIELAEWPDLVLLVPLSASTLARLVHGLADTLLASTLMATRAPVLAAAARNTDMWESPAVQRNWQQLQSDRPLLALPPATEGLLACDRRGSGRMVEPSLLLQAAASLAVHGVQRDFEGLELLITAGPTQEFLDPARVNAAVLHQLQDGPVGDLTAVGVVAGEHDHPGGLVDEDVHAGGHLEGADVAPVTADDPALHVVGRELDDAHGRVRHDLGSQALDR